LNLFDVYFPLLFPSTNNTYKLRVIRPGASIEQSVLINTLSLKERRDQLKASGSPQDKSNQELWKLDFWENQTAYLRLRTFDVFALPFEWQPFLRNAFQQIRQKQTKHLVVDIRWNDGGQDEVLLALGKYLTRKPISRIPRIAMVRYKTVADSLRPYLFSWNKSIYNFEDQIKSVDGDFFVLKTEEEFQIKPASNAFTGNVILLTNAANASAAFYFTEVAKANQIATLIGETTGGSQKGLNGGQMFFLRLPHSKIEIDVPVIGSFSPEKPDAGITPHYSVQESVNDIVNNIDPVIQFAKTWIQQNNN